MISAIERRLKALEKSTVISDRASFVCEDGSSFSPKKGPFSYLVEFGKVSPDGKAITGIRYDATGLDPLSASIMETLRGVVEGSVPSVEDTVLAMESR